MKKSCFFICFVLFVRVSPMWGQGIASSMNRLLSSNLFATSDVGLSIYDLTDDAPLYVYRDKKMARPASTEKLITSIAYLARLGLSSKFYTRVYYTGHLGRNGTLYGDLYVHGGFDPEFMDSDMDKLIAELKDTGLTKVKGKIYGDVSFMDSLYYGAGWCWDDAPYEFQPMLSPLMLHKGCLEVIATSSLSNKIPQVRIRPFSSYYTVTNKMTSNAEGNKSFSVDRDWMNGGNNLLLTGSVCGTKKKMVTVSRPASFFMHVFMERACRKGILMKCFGGFKMLPSNVTSLLEYSHSTSEVLRPALKESDNLSAEALFYHLGAWHKGVDSCFISAKDGVDAIKGFIDELGYDPDDYEIYDGCGVSLYNYVTPELMLAFLKYAYSKPEIYKELIDALPIAGIDGTLKNRMKKGRALRNVRAKTGSLSGISTLVGYLHAANGHEVAFVIMNQNVMKTKEARAFQDKVCELLCGMW
ncbi:D-alanyl-D-alanine carboxypeptidase/D-alanyl-D-alanine-endopeptidase [uncultured Bacteroides sp.]|uniref:D-alanyl-D-alanine carboxypeptidase/D-alanyl-D-alanine endopeptidase n=1 Tax=uncultured Bacteroides sp. TaxID=162156 RepID=UPI002AAA6A82|nr:D-alanyl-D-alanine carboxypeptidase/D-alanyl-D-alanine-endopeptidase [uncultured Bacteroides sp.]